MDKFLETRNLPKLNPEESENLHRLITTRGIEAVIKKTPDKQKPCVGWFPGEFYQTFKEELTPLPLKQFQKKMQEKRRFPSSF